MQTTDTLCGIERSPGAGFYGKIVCPKIYIREHPGGEAVGWLAHKTPVVVLASQSNGSRTWYKIQGKRGWKKITGWVLESFLLELGK